MTVAIATPGVGAAPSRTVRRGWRPRYDGDFPTLGWGALSWTFAFLPSPADEQANFRYTDEQARRVLRIYELDPITGARLYRRVSEEEAKGWGKSPFAASLALAEFCGPVVFDGWDADGQPVGRPWGTMGSPLPWVQIAAVSEAQTQNTYNSLYWFLTADNHRASRDLKIDEGRTRLYLRDKPAAKLEVVTASAGSREGQPITHCVADEPQLWTPQNGGDKLIRTVLRNLTKTNGWAHLTGNAPVVGLDSVAETFSVPAEGALHFATRPGETPREDWPRGRKLHALGQVYRDVPWITDHMDRVIADVEDPAVPWSEKLRFSFNVRTAGTTEDAWMDMDAWDACAGDVVLAGGIPTYVVVRIAHDHRAAAIATAQSQGARVALRVRCFPTEELPADEYLPVSELEDHLRSLRQRYPAAVMAIRRSAGGKEFQRAGAGPEISSHGSFFQGSAQRLQGTGAVVSDLPSSPERITVASETLMRLVTSGGLVHDGAPELARQVANVVAKPVAKGWTISANANPGSRIVAAQAAMLAVHRAATAPPAPSRAMSYPRPR